MNVKISQKQKYCKHKLNGANQCVLCGYVVKTIKIFRPTKKGFL